MTFELDQHPKFDSQRSVENARQTMAMHAQMQLTLAHLTFHVMINIPCHS